MGTPPAAQPQRFPRLGTQQRPDHGDQIPASPRVHPGHGVARLGADERDPLQRRLQHRPRPDLPHHNPFATAPSRSPIVTQPSDTPQPSSSKPSLHTSNATSSDPWARGSYRATTAMPAWPPGALLLPWWARPPDQPH